MHNSRLFLRVASKLMLSFALLWLLYVFSRGLFEPPATTANSADKQRHQFDLSDLHQSTQVTAARYFSVGRRELLVIRLADDYRVYWAHDPVYGCRLQYEAARIKPVCIDIEYDVQGVSETTGQRLKSPDYEISEQQLRVFPR